MGQLDAARLRRSAQIYERLNIAPPLSEAQLEGFIYQSNAALRLTPEEQSWLEDNPVIKLGIDRDFAPYEWINSKGNYQGLAAEYIQLLQAKLGVEFDIIDDKPWHEIIAMAQRGELDMLSCLHMSPERSEYLLFSQPFITNPVVIVNANRFGYIGHLDNLRGKTVAVEKSYHVQENLARNYPDITLIFTETTLEALKGQYRRSRCLCGRCRICQLCHQTSQPDQLTIFRTDAAIQCIQNGDKPVASSAAIHH